MRKELSPKKKEAIERIKAKIYSYSEQIHEEYDIMELIEDNIKEIFACDLDCSTCTAKEQGQCMQAFKKANLYFLRKLYLDETTLLEFTNNIRDMIDLVLEIKEELKKSKDEAKNERKEKFKKRFEEVKQRHDSGRKTYDDYFQ
jgi:hypothetical protein